jgi:small-conductance mechanosensitive channel
MPESTIAQILYLLNKPFLHIGQTPITIGGIASAFLVVIAAYFLSAFTQRILLGRLTNRLHLTSGMAYAARRLIHYTIILLGIIVAAQCVGLNFGSLAVVFGFLSVGIGFGLQNVTSNFMAGLIMLLEQPISVGDFISVETQIGKVTQINMRSTVIQTLDNISIIIPNSKLIENNVINWSHTDPQIRIHCPVGVAYGSDVKSVKSALLNAVRGLDAILEKPAPEVRLIQFGESSLDFELLVWTDSPEKQFFLKSQINFAVEEALRAAQIRIPFPQRDLHIVSTPDGSKGGAGNLPA